MNSVIDPPRPANLDPDSIGRPGTRFGDRVLGPAFETAFGSRRASSPRRRVEPRIAAPPRRRRCSGNGVAEDIVRHRSRGPFGTAAGSDLIVLETSHVGR